MNKNIIRLLLPVSLFLSFSNVKGQTDVIRELSGKFINYCREMPREEAFINTDREEYIAGEEMWFSAWLFDRQTSGIRNNSSVVYVELVNSDNHPIGQKRVKIDKGFGSGEILLSDTITTGCYTLRAYTSWMKNFLPQNCFTKKITIFNALGKTECISCKTDAGKILSSSGNSWKPAPSSDYFRFNVTGKTENIELSIEASDYYRSANNNICYLFIESHGNIEYTGTVNLTSPRSLFSVGSGYLKRGISHITFFDSKGVPQAEKYIYIRGKEDDPLKITTPDSFSRREKVSVEITTDKSLNFSPDSSNISITVIPKSNLHAGRINDYMIFGSEFGILPDNIADKNPDELPESALDTFLAGTRSNWIDWNIILSGKYPVNELSPEKETHILTGRLLNRNSQQPVSNKFLILSIPGKQATFQYSVTSNEGKFRFRIPVIENEQDLVIQPQDNDKGNTIEILAPFDEKYHEGIFSSTVTGKMVPDYIAQWSTNYQVNRIYGTVFSKPPENILQQSPVKKSFYGKPDIGLILDDYIKLPVMQEVFFELLPGISLRSHKSVYEIVMMDPFTKSWQKIKPILFIDGVMVNDATAIANLDPEIVERIDVITGKYFVGDFIFYGLVNVITRAGDFSCTTLPEQAVRLKYNVMDAEALFMEPENREQTNVPDFRNTLYWNPSVRPDKDGKLLVNFRTSDNTGEYEIIVQGLTTDGKPLTGKKSIKVQ